MRANVLGYTYKRDASGARQIRSDKAFKAVDKHHRGNKEDTSVCLNCAKPRCTGRCADIMCSKK